MARKLTALLLGTLAALLIAEGCLRALAVYQQGTLRADPASDRTEDTFRILSIGDSNTYGIAVERSEAYPARLQALLNGQRSEARFEVVNLGVPGTNSSQLRNRLPEYLETYDPDLVIVLIGVNDYWNGAEVDGSIDEPWVRRLHRRLLGLRTYRLAVLLADSAVDDSVVGIGASPELATDQGAEETHHELRHGRREYRYVNDRTTLTLDDDEHEALLEENYGLIRAISREHGVPLVFTTYAHGVGHYGVANRVVLRQGGKEETLVVPLQLQPHLIDALATYEPDQLFFHSLHPQAPVYAAFAERLCEALIEAGLVPTDHCG